LTLTLERFDLVEAANEVVERLREMATNDGCEIVLRAPGSLLGTWDRLRIEQALTNVVSNAIKYASGKPIEVLVSTQGTDARLDVQDQGPGIPEAALGRIFERFERATSSRHYGGMGLGLYVTRQIVEAHGGRVTANNLPGGGASISMRLPVHRDAPAASPSEGAP
jgi:signal transduction histidine kinase